jgi:uncharacterized membrane protein YgdD (TMEM256/DUF423 family)
MLAGTAVALGAFGAHGLADSLRDAGREANLDQRLDWFETGVRYQFSHALACLAIGLTGSPPLGRVRAVGWAFAIGVLLFCGTLYAMTLGPDAWRKLGAVTPLGGLSFLVGWALLVVDIARTPK